MQSLNGKRFLLTNIYLKNYAGSEINCLSLAKELKSRGATVEVATFVFDDPIRSDYEKEGISVKTVLDQPSMETHFDVIWAHHSMVLDYLLFKHHVTADKIIFSSLSPFEPYEAPPAYIHNLSLCLANSEETKQQLILEGVEPSKIMVFPNYVGEIWLNAPVKKDFSLHPKSAAIVSNHVPQELLEAKLKLEQNSCKVDIYGLNHIECMITPQILSNYDLVITIGKTVQFAMCLQIPVYCYDIYGGPGYITLENLETAAFHNFSGRDFCKKDSSLIVDEILSQYNKQYSVVTHLREYVLCFFAICTKTQAV